MCGRDRSLFVVADLRADPLCADNIGLLCINFVGHLSGYILSDVWT